MGTSEHNHNIMVVTVHDFPMISLLEISFDAQEFQGDGLQNYTETVSAIMPLRFDLKCI